MRPSSILTTRHADRRRWGWLAGVTLVDIWKHKHGQAEVTTSEILTMVHKEGIFPRVTAGLESGAPARLARQVLKDLINRPVGNFIVRRRGHGGSSRYALSESMP